MSIDMSIHQLSRLRYDDLLREAEEERLAARARRQNGVAPITDQLLLNLSNWLIDAGARLKQRTELRLDLG